MITILVFTSCIDDSSTSHTTTKTEINQEEITDELISSYINEAISQENIINKTKPVSSEYNFNFNNLEGQSIKLNVKNDHYNFKNIKQPIVMVAFLSTWCPPCRGQIPHLSNLQKNFKNDLFILSVLIHDDIKEKELKKFLIAEKARFYLSNNQVENLKFSHMIAPKLRLKNNFTLPLMLIFYKGKYFTHYEGRMPEEMIESDLEQLLKKYKGQK